MIARALHVIERHWPLARPFRISRGEKSHAAVIEVNISQGAVTGRGESVPYGRYGETVLETIQTIKAQAPAIGAGMGREELSEVLEPGAARNAIDCALWDLEAKMSGQRVWELAGLPRPRPLVTAFTLSVDSPAALSRAAREHRERPLLKLKLAGDGADLERVQAVHQAAPKADLWIDANEGLNMDDCRAMAPVLGQLGVRVFEQPLPAGGDDELLSFDCEVPLCADESFWGGVESVQALSSAYELVNVKLDKTGGLTEALKVVRALQDRGVGVVVGCMCSSSLSVAPAILLAQSARFADLDGAWLLAEDQDHGLQYAEGRVHPSSPILWG